MNTPSRDPQSNGGSHQNKEWTVAALKEHLEEVDRIRESHRKEMLENLFSRVESAIQRLYGKVGNLSEKMDELQSRLDRQEGKSSGYHSGWKVLLSVFGFILTLATLLNIYLNIRSM